jgi:hypothetical protein
VSAHHAGHVWHIHLLLGCASAMCECLHGLTRHCWLHPLLLLSCIAVVATTAMHETVTSKWQHSEHLCSMHLLFLR